MDVPTADDASVRSRLDQLASSDISFKALFGITGTVTKFITIMSQLSVLLAVFRHEKGGAEFAALALIQPLFLMFAVSDGGLLNYNGGKQTSFFQFPNRGYRARFFSAVFAVFQANSYHKRMTDVETIVSRAIYREELVGSGLRQYILDGKPAYLCLLTPLPHLIVSPKEYNKADKALGDTPINDPWDTRPPTTYWKSMLPWITLDLPWVGCHHPNNVVYDVKDSYTSAVDIVTWLQNLRQVYDAIRVDNQIIDGTLDYPQSDNTPEAGMKVEFK